jgi:hypothetical protein
MNNDSLTPAVDTTASSVGKRGILGRFRGQRRRRRLLALLVIIVIAYFLLR